MELHSKVNYPEVPSHNHMNNSNTNNIVNNFKIVVDNAVEVAKDTSTMIKDGVELGKETLARIKENMIEAKKNLSTYEKTNIPYEDLLKFVEKAAIEKEKTYITIWDDCIKPKDIKKLIDAGFEVTRASDGDVPYEFDSKEKIFRKVKEEKSCFCPGTSISGIDCINIHFDGFKLL